MSQFIMFESQTPPESNVCTMLTEYSDLPNYGFLSNIAAQLFSGTPHSRLWVIEDFHYLCDLAIEQLAGKLPLKSTNLYKAVLPALLVSNKIAFWYANDFENLPTINEEDALLKAIEKSLAAPSFEIYALYAKKQAEE